MVALVRGWSEYGLSCRAPAVRFLLVGRWWFAFVHLHWRPAVAIAVLVVFGVVVRRVVVCRLSAAGFQSVDLALAIRVCL